MKKSSIALFVLLSAVSLHLPAGTLLAQSPVQTPPAQIKFLGTTDDMVIFTVNYLNPDGGKFTVIVKDQDKSLLYQHTFTDRGFVRQFKLPRADRSRIAFTIRTEGQPDLNKTFEINVNDRAIQEFAVKKVY